MTKEEREELGLPLRQADPDTFKHEPADYEQPVEAVAVEQLAACPFCQFDGVEITHPPAPYAVSCLGCYAEGPQADSRAEAIAAWNTRTQANEAMREALTPSGDTKAAYHGEFSFNIAETVFDEQTGDFDVVSRKVYVPWTTVKEIMAAILARAEARNALSGDSA